MTRVLVIHGAGMNMRGKVHALALRGIRDMSAAKK
jgi:hypothetical protein